jgi:hypothetical protein
MHICQTASFLPVFTGSDVPKFWSIFGKRNAAMAAARE